MNKKLLVGGLAIVGAVALIAWYKKPKKNSEGFFSASGTRCVQCKRPNGTYYTPSRWDDAGSGGCMSGAVCVKKASIQA